MAGWGTLPWGLGPWGLGLGTGDNLDFEIAGPAPGIPDQWVLVPAMSGLMHLVFDGGPSTWDDFSWDGDAVADFTVITEAPFTDGPVEVFSWDGAFVDESLLSQVTFGLATPVPAQYDSFEGYWLGNQGWITDFVGVGTDLTQIVFTGGSVEDFESDWESNQDWLDDFVGPGTDLTVVLWDGIGAETVEDFEEVRTPLQFFVTTGTDTISTVSIHQLSLNDQISFANDLGVLPSPLLEDPTPYFVQAALSGNSIRATEFVGGALIDILTFGTGIHTLIHDRTRYWVETID